MKNIKYIALGILVGYLGLYVYEITINKDNIIFCHSYESDDEEEEK